jgi:hypothetical protein
MFHGEVRAHQVREDRLIAKAAREGPSEQEENDSSECLRFVHSSSAPVARTGNQWLHSP